MARIPARFKFNPSYMHTFGLTVNFFVIVEQPLTVSVPKVFKSHLMNDPLISCMEWFPEKQVSYRANKRLIIIYYQSTKFFH